MRWGFLGASRIGQSRLTHAVREAEGTLVAVAASEPTRAQQYASQNGFQRAEHSYAALLEARDIDAIYVSLTNDQHVPWVIRGLQAGKHVLCEKPLGMNANEITQLQAVQAQGNMQVMEAFVHFFHPQVAFAQQAIQNGMLGQLLAGQAEFVAHLGRPDDFRWQPEKGGGALLDVGCYAVSALRWLTDNVPHSVSASAHWQGEVDGTLTGQLISPAFCASLTCSLESPSGQRLTLWGTDGALVLELPFSAIERPATVWVKEMRHQFPAMNPYVSMVRAFQQACQSGQPVPLSLADSLIQAQTLDALLQSAKTGHRVTV